MFGEILTHATHRQFGEQGLQSKSLIHEHGLAMGKVAVDDGLGAVPQVLQQCRGVNIVSPVAFLGRGNDLEGGKLRGGHRLSKRSPLHINTVGRLKAQDDGFAGLVGHRWRCCWHFWGLCRGHCFALLVAGLCRLAPAFKVLGQVAGIGGKAQTGMDGVKDGPSARSIVLHLERHLFDNLAHRLMIVQQVFDCFAID
ncbi:hypothetical protein CCP4SC76_4890002 [Gammaproteobacteria bacterium]